MMDDDDIAHDDIERLEARLERLAESIERCRKIAFVAKLMIFVGTAWVVLMFIGLASSATAGLAVAVAMVIGGTVLFGSNSSTWEQKEAQRRKAEALRAELIERLDLHVVGEQRRLH